MIVMTKCALLLAFAGLSMAADAPKSFTGIVQDDMCGGDHKKMGGTDAANCTAECIKEMGAKYALVVDHDVYVLSDQKQAAKYANKKVTVTGTLDGKDLKVAKIVSAK